MSYRYAGIVSLFLSLLIILAGSNNTQLADAAQNSSSDVHPRLHDSLEEDQSSNIPEEQVASVADYRDISKEDARMLLAVEERLRMTRSNIRRRIGEPFAGLSINDKLIGEITIRTTSSGDEPIALAESESGISDIFKHEVVEHNYAELQTVKNELSAPSAEEIKERYNSVYSALDERRNAVVVGVQNEPREAEREFREEFGDEVVARASGPSHLEDVPNSSLSCRDDSRQHCNPLRGGTALQPHNGGDTAYCTLGFNAYDEVYTGVPFVVTAGHCLDDSTPTTHHSGSEIGDASFISTSGNADAGRIEIEEAGWEDSYYFYRLPSSQAVHVQNVHRNGTLSPGTDISISAGNSDDYMTGEVRNGDLDLEEYDLHNMLGYDMCTQDGDSGSPVVISTTAIAVHAGDYSDTLATQPSGCYKFGSYVENVEDSVNVRIRTSGDDP